MEEIALLAATLPVELVEVCPPNVCPADEVPEPELVLVLVLVLQSDMGRIVS